MSPNAAGLGGHDCLIGGAGSDRIDGGAGSDGTNAYDAGRGNDYVDARNGKRELVRCGPGFDRARADRQDRLRSCKRVR